MGEAQDRIDALPDRVVIVSPAVAARMVELDPAMGRYVFTLPIEDGTAFVLDVDYLRERL